MRQLWKKLTFWVDRKPSKVNFSTRLIAYALDLSLIHIFIWEESKNDRNGKKYYWDDFICWAK